MGWPMTSAPIPLPDFDAVDERAADHRREVRRVGRIYGRAEHAPAAKKSSAIRVGVPIVRQSS